MGTHTGRSRYRRIAIAAQLAAVGWLAAANVSAQNADDLLAAVEFYHANATSDVALIHEATKRFETIAIASPPDPDVPDSWLPAYWTSFAYTQLGLFADDERSGPYVRLSRAYYEQALAAKPSGNSGTDADFHALEGLLLGFEASRAETAEPGASREAWGRARAADSNNPMMLMNGGLALIVREETRDRAYGLLERAIELYEPRLGTVRPNWGREFIDVWMGSYPRGEASGDDLLDAASDGWTVVRDEGAGGDPARIEREAAGLRILTGASSVLQWSDVRTSPPFRLEVTIQQFDPARRNEGYGLVFGMRPEGSRWSYDYFLIRQDGQVLVKRREGAETSVLRDWTEEAAVRGWSERDDGSPVVTNTLVLHADGERVRLEVNGASIYEAPAGELRTDGSVGLRVNHGLSLRVVDFRVDEAGSGDRDSSGGVEP